MVHFLFGGARRARWFNSCSCAALALVVAFACLARAAPAATSGILQGTLVSSDGAPVKGALVTLSGNGSDRTQSTDVKGSFAFTNLAPGTYIVRATARGYDTNGGRTIEVSEGTPATIQLTMTRSAGGLVTIGQVLTAGGQALSTSSAPSTTINSQNYAALGYTMVSDVLQNNISTTLFHVLGGSLALPTSVALRGPDPTETLIDIDGHQINSGNSGDFDLSLLDPADFSSIELVKGIAPGSLVGPDTIDGAVNLRTLEPTTDPHGAFRLFFGSFDSFGATLETTGTADHLGYVVSLHRTTTAGETSQTIYALADSPSGGTGPQYVGSAVNSSTALAKLRYSFGRGDAYLAVSFHDQSQYRDLSAGLSSVPPAPGSLDSGDGIGRHTGGLSLDDAVSAGPGAGGLTELESYAGSSLSAHNSGISLDFHAPLGAPNASGVASTYVLYRHYNSLVAQSVFGPAADTSPYLYNDRDSIADDTLEIDHQFNKGQLTLQYDLRDQTLNTNFVSGILNDESIGRHPLGYQTRPLDDQTGSGPDQAIQLNQIGRSGVIRYTGDPSSKFHFAVATYFTNYSTFGNNIDPRFGLTWTPDAQTVVRSSFGTTFQIPQLPELFTPPVLPPPVGGYITVGNPHLKPDYAAEYGLGFEHIFAPGPNRYDFSVDTYRVNLRNPAVPYLPPPSTSPNCGGSSGSAVPAAPQPAATPMCPLTYPVNAGNGIYQGIEVQASHPLANYTMLRAGWAIRSAYLTLIPPDIQDGTLVFGEQALGVPLHKMTFALDHSPPHGLNYGAGIVWEGEYNELDQPPFAVLNANMGYRFPGGYELALAGTNLTNIYDQRFTRQSAGVPYLGVAGPLATDAYFMQGAAFSLVITRKF